LNDVLHPRLRVIGTATTFDGYVHKELSKKWADAGEPDKGDCGGNEILVSPATGDATNLDSYFDSMFGGCSSVFGAIYDTYGFGTKPNLAAARLANLLKSALK
jgi:hypothetical protein